MNTDQVLAPLGLQIRKSAGDYLWTALGVFGTGMLVGAGVALMLTPKTGKELRGDIEETASRVGKKITKVRNRHTNGFDHNSASRDELYSKAQELDIPGRSDMTKEELADAISST